MLMTVPKTSELKPLIKWTGGKYREFRFFSSFIPPFERYFEPFFGGGGVYFALGAPKNSLVNDKSSDLIQFYKAIQNNALSNGFEPFLRTWEAIGELAIQEDEAFSLFVQLVRKGKSSSIDLKLNEWVNSTALGLDEQREKLGQFIKRFVPQKASRIHRIEQFEGRLFTQAELRQHWETALKSGFYFYLRSLLEQDEDQSSTAFVAAWFLVRELCYGSMFRYNKDGKFNIPYGGIAYNKKDIRAKTELILSERVYKSLQGTHFHNQDFEEFLSDTKPGKGDFIFIDPPYDSEFSEYDRSAFTQQDQLRLAETLYQQEANWMLVIKETKLIRSLYQRKGIHLMGFDKTYVYNVRGRNDREAHHLIITNYDPARL
jgi:DNA adenine methylase